MKLASYSIRCISSLMPMCFVILAVLTRKALGNTDEIQCEPRAVVLPTKNYHTHGNSIIPQHFTIHRCSGGDVTAPSTYRCEPTKKKEIRIDLKARHSFYAIQEDFFKVENHTECDMKCVCERIEKCRKGLTVATCQDGFSWDKDYCECKPRCTVVGETNKPEGEEETTISLTIFIIVLVVEFIIVALVTFFIIDALKCKKHSKGVIHRTAIYVRSLSVSDKDSCKIPTLKRNRTDTGSVSFLHEVNHDSNSNYKNNNIAANV